MKYDAGWLISVFALGIAMLALYRLSRARLLWNSDAAALKAAVEKLEATCGTEVTEVRQSLSAIESGMVNAQESLREGRLNPAVRSQALQLLRKGAPPETVAGKLGIAVSEARLLTRVGQVLAGGAVTLFRA